MSTEAATGEGTPLDVLVIGAGPSGLFTAIQLARGGVRPRIVDSRPGAHEQSRATTIMPSTVYLLKLAGVADRFLDAAVRINRFAVRNAALEAVSAVELADLDTPMPFALTLPQWMTEQFLSERLAELGVEVERSTSATDVDMRVDGTGVSLEGPAGRELVDARAVVDAGGTHSLVRAAMRQVLQGGTYEHRFAVADVRINSELPRDEITRVATPDGVVLLGPLPEGRTILVIDIPREKPLSAAPTLEQMRSLMDERLLDSPQLLDLRWSSCFELHHRIAKSFGDIRRYLVGDAAHIESLFSGMGMNAGLHDAANLGWKLAYCLRQKAHAGLLHTYVLERRPADERSMSISDASHQRVMTAGEAQPAASPAAGARTSPSATPIDPRRMLLMLDEHYEDSPLVGARPDPTTVVVPGLVPGTLFPDFSCPPTSGHALYLGEGATAPAEFLQRWREIVELIQPPPACIPARALVLVRPDGFIAFVSARADGAAFAQLDGMLGSWFRLPGWFRSEEAIR